MAFSPRQCFDTIVVSSHIYSMELGIDEKNNAGARAHCERQRGVALTIHTGDQIFNIIEPFIFASGVSSLITCSSKSSQALSTTTGFNV